MEQLRDERLAAASATRVARPAPGAPPQPRLAPDRLVSGRGRVVGATRNAPKGAVQVDGPVRAELLEVERSRLGASSDAVYLFHWPACRSRHAGLRARASSALSSAPSASGARCARGGSRDPAGRSGDRRGRASSGRRAAGIAQQPLRSVTPPAGPAPSAVPRPRRRCPSRCASRRGRLDRLVRRHRPARRAQPHPGTFVAAKAHSPVRSRSPVRSASVRRTPRPTCPSAADIARWPRPARLRARRVAVVTGARTPSTAGRARRRRGPGAGAGPVPAQPMQRTSIASDGAPGSWSPAPTSRARAPATELRC